MLVELYPPNVRALRQEWGMSAAALAEAAGLTAPTARRAERGEPVSVATARSLAAVLRVNPPQRLGRPHRS
jgi:transcriptional regulator with XRE-family HTH domain